MEIKLIQTQFIPLSKLEVNKGQVEGIPSNPRRLDDDAFAKLKKSIEERPGMLALRELCVYPHGNKFVVLGGNMRLRAMRELKYKEAPCKVIPEDTPLDELKAFVVVDNSSFGAWDYDALANEWDDLPLQDWGVPVWEDNTTEEETTPAQPDTVQDDFDEETEKVETRCNPGDIWQLGDHRLMCGDSTDADTVKKLMDGSLADMVFTDPPYGTTQLAWDKEPDLSKMFTCLITYSKDNAALLIFGTQPFVTDLINAKRDLFKYEIVWEKSQATGFFNAKKAPLRIHENIIVFYDRLPTYNPIKTIKEVHGKIGRKRVNSDYRKITGGFMGKVGLGKADTWEYIEDGTRYPTDVVKFSNWNGVRFGNKENAVVHPTQKPIPLADYFIKTYSNDGEIVLDPFGGSGTTLIAAEQLGRRCYTMELDPHYCDVIISRWETITGKTAQLITPGDKVS